MNDEQIFWNRLEDMPDIEAVQEIQFRIDNLVLQNYMLLNEKIKAANKSDEQDCGIAINENNLLISTLTSKRKFLNLRIDRLNWRNAVKANFGDEGYLKCKIWMEANR